MLGKGAPRKLKPCPKCTCGEGFLIRCNFCCDFTGILTATRYENILDVELLLLTECISSGYLQLVREQLCTAYPGLLQSLVANLCRRALISTHIWCSVKALWTSNLKARIRKFQRKLIPGVFSKYMYVDHLHKVK